MRVLIAVGGTGGHLFPALRLAEDLVSMGHTVQFAGGGFTRQCPFPKKSYRYHTVSSSPSIRRVKTLLQGFFESGRILQTMQPDLLVGFGSYHTLPLLAAAAIRCRTPIMLHEQNCVRGRLNRLFAPFAVAVTSSFPGLGEEVTFPIRIARSQISLSRSEIFSYFSLNDTRKTLFIMGGSQGAEALNQFAKSAIPVWKKFNLQVIHLTGNKMWASELKTAYAKAKIPHFVRPFYEKTHLAWSIAEAAITRAGASSLFEQVEYEVPGIVVPYPFATDNHQKKNADALCHHIPAIRKIDQNNLSKMRVEHVLEELLKDKKQEPFASYKRGRSQKSLAHLVIEKGQR